MGALLQEAEMGKRVATLTLVALLAGFAFAKDKNKSPLPFYVLHAKTVIVLIDPKAGFSIDDPQANPVAQRDVETALLNWGRYNPILQEKDADLIIVLRKGTGRLASGTIRDPRQNQRAGSINPIENSDASSTEVGMQSPRGGASSNEGVSPQAEIGDQNDSFLVYAGGGDRPLDKAPVWRYSARDGLRPHDVPAVEAFRKAVADADKIEAKKP
jgi:hypothetical protein